MSAELLLGKPTADLIYQDVQRDLEKLLKAGIEPQLTVVLVGEDPASKVYVGMKEKACKKLGLGSETKNLPADTSEKDLLALIDALNADASVHGILVQLPLPKHISSQKVIERISPDKDVDGFHPVNRGRLVAGQDCFLPCTPAGVQQLLIRNGYETAGKHIVVIGRSLIVGLPFSIMMMQKRPDANATVTLCHTGTQNLVEHTLHADILVVASGRPNTVSGDMVKSGCIVIDVGVNRIKDDTAKRGYRLIGDVDFDTVEPRAKAITPVPGGVGPMTIAMLIHNTIKAAKRYLLLD